MKDKPNEQFTAVKNAGNVWASSTCNAISEQITATDDMDNTTIPNTTGLAGAQIGYILTREKQFLSTNWQVILTELVTPATNLSKMDIPEHTDPSVPAKFDQK